jgi:ATPase subunit of ABC transporter with duplicated ATPase domains
VLDVQNLRKSYGAAAVLNDFSFVLNDGERVGLIGPNGTGKSTLLRCLAGAERPDAGTVVLSPVGARIGYLPQAFAEGDQRTLGQLLDEALAEVRSAEVALDSAAQALANTLSLRSTRSRAQSSWSRTTAPSYAASPVACSSSATAPPSSRKGSSRLAL